MEALKPCPCGKTPANLCIMDGSTYRWRYVSGICCGEWHIEARVDRADRTDAEAIEAECVRAWNDAPRASPLPGELVERIKATVLPHSLKSMSWSSQASDLLRDILAWHEGRKG